MSPPSAPGTAVWPLRILALLAIAATTHFAREVILPILWAGLGLAAVWPIYTGARRMASPAVAALLVLALLLAVLGALTGGLIYGTQAFHQALSSGGGLQRVRDTLASLGVDTSSARGLGDPALSWAKRAAISLTGIVLLLALVTLGSLEVRSWREWLGRAASAPQRAHWQRVFGRFGREIRAYLVVRTGLGVATGLLVTLGSWALGLRLAVVWGLTNFILNYIPTVGSVLGVIPPVVFAWLDGGPTQALVALLVVGGVQIVMGNWVDPLVQGHYLQLSPFAVLVVISLGGWLWGPWGAFIAVPLTIFAVHATAGTRYQPVGEWLAGEPVSPEARAKSGHDWRHRA